MPASGHGRFSDAAGAWLDHLGNARTSSATLAAYRRDLDGIARRIADPGDVARLRLRALTKGALRAGFASWATDHAASSVRRAQSAWSSFFDFLVTEDLREGNPMAAVPKPRRTAAPPRAIRHPEAASRLLATAAAADPRGRNPWPNGTWR